MRNPLGGILATLLLTLSPPHARATYSIAGADKATRQIGGAATSCVAPGSVFILYGPVPGHGLVHAQAAFSAAGKSLGQMQLGMDVAPADIITMLTSAAFDANFNTRQYGIVDLMGRTAAFTGGADGVVALHHTGMVGSFVYSAQGNILSNRSVVD